MKIILNSRACGKTYAMAMRLKKNPEMVMFVMSEQEAERICKQYDLPKTQVCSWSNYKDKMMGLHRPILIDNADMFLQQLFNGQIYSVSMNTDDQEQELKV
jgi:hypothetical protein